MCGTINPGSCIWWVLSFGIKTGYDARAGVTTQLLRGEESLLHLRVVHEPKLRLDYTKPVVSLERLSYLGEEQWMSGREATGRWLELEQEHFLPHCHQKQSWPWTAIGALSAHCETRGSRRWLEPRSVTEVGLAHSPESPWHQPVRCECSPLYHPNKWPLA
jgi:hypothetical protein